MAEIPTPEVRRFNSSLTRKISEKSGKFDENHDEYINIDINEITMRHKGQEFGDKDAHSRNEMTKSTEGRCGKSKQEKGGDTELRRSAEHDVLGRSLRVDRESIKGTKVQVRP